jgi:hypothetical protein
LNLVNVAGPLKVARLILGVDDSDPSTTVLLPRLPPSWKNMEAHNWPILTNHGVVRADISFTASGKGAVIRMTMRDKDSLTHLRVRMPSSVGYVWREHQSSSKIYFRTR